MPTCIYSCIDVWSRIRFWIEFVWIRSNFLYSLSSLAPIFHSQPAFLSQSRFHLLHHPSVATIFFPLCWPSRTAILPLSFYIIPFKPNLFSKENNSKIFSETFFYKIVSDSLFNYFWPSLRLKNNSFHSIIFYILHVSPFVLI
jgi:hypothetical protein